MSEEPRGPVDGRETFDMPRTYRAAIRVASWLAPPGERDALRREWESEVWHALRSGRARTGIVWRTAWCGMDAMWLWRREVGMRGWTMDVKATLRSFAHAPGLSLAIALTLAIGLGVGTAMFAVVDTVLLRSLPLPQSDRLVRFSQERPANAQRDWGYSYAMVRALDEGLDAARIGAYSGAQFNVVGPDGPIRVGAVRASHAFIPVTGLPLARGRAYTAEEELAGLKVAVVSHEFWRDVLGADPAALGRSVSLGTTPYEVVGVTAPGIDLVRELSRRSGAPDERTDLYLPLHEFGSAQGDLTSTIRVIGRLADGSTVERVRAEAFQIIDGFLNERGATGWQTEAHAVHDHLVSPSRQPLLILLGAVGALLLMVCANLAGLMLVRGVGRSQEWAARRALGANPGRIIRQVLTESASLAGIGGAAGLLVASFTLGWLVTQAPTAVPRTTELGLDWRVALFAFALTSATALLFGLIPAVSAAGRSGTSALTASRQTLGRGPRRVLRALVATQVTMAVVLLAGSGVLVRSLGELLQQDPGYAAGHVVYGWVELPAERYAADADVLLFSDVVQQKLQALPGVERAIPSSIGLPLQGPRIRFQKEDVAGEDGIGGAQQVAVGPGYFEALDIDLEEGRAFTSEDRAGAPGVAVITRALANRYWPGESPLGKRITIGSWRTFMTLGTSTAPISREIVGVTEDLTQVGVDPPPPTEMLFAPFEQDPWAMHGYLVETRADAAAAIAGLRRVVAEVDGSQPVYGTGTLLEDVRASIDRERLSTLVLAGFAVVALLLAVLGIYGVVAYSVGLRRREIGVRVALGADSGTVSRLFFVEGLAPVALGALAGFVLAAAAVRSLQGLLYGVSPLDPVAFAGAAVVLGVAALGSTYLPARRTARVDPVDALRGE